MPGMKPVKMEVRMATSILHHVSCDDSSATLGNWNFVLLLVAALKMILRGALLLNEDNPID